MKSFLQRSYLAIILFFLYFPILILIVYSTNQSTYSLQWHGFTGMWYKLMLSDTVIWTALFNSVILGVSAAVIATSMGLLACMHVFLNPEHGKYNRFLVILLILITIPDIVLGVSLLIFFNFSSIPLGFPSLLIAHITFCLPFAVLTIHSRMCTLDANIYLSALDLGASRLTALTKVILPILFPAVLGALLLCFTLSFDDVVISYFVSGPEFNILPLVIYSLVRTGITPELNALGTVIFLISCMLVLTSYRLARTST